MKQFLVAGLLLLSCGLAWGLSPAELAEKSRLTGVPLQNLLAEFAPLPEDASNMSQTEFLYLQYKLTQTPLPHWLQTAVNPVVENGQGSRVGGDTDADAVEIELEVGGDAYTDSGTTVGLSDHTTVACTIDGSPLGCVTAASNQAPDAWYVITLDTQCTMTASLCGSSYDTMLFFFDEDYIQQAGNDDYCSLQSQVSCLMPAGTYYVVVDGYSTNSGAYTLSVSLADVCADYTDALLTLNEIPGSISGNTTGAPDVINSAAGDVGIEFTLDTDGVWDINSCLEGTSFSVDLYLYDGNPCEDGELLLSNTNYAACSEHSYSARIRNQELNAGTYHLVVSNTGTSEGAFTVEVQPAPDAPSSGGPDEFGYTWISSEDAEGPEFEWIDVSGTGTVLSLSDDDCSDAIDLGFTFPYYEESYSSVHIASNGYIGFTTTGMSSLGSPGIPNEAAPNDLIAGFWDDLNPTGTSSVIYESQPEEGRFIVQYNGIPPYGSTGAFYFQIVLYESGDFWINLLDMMEEDLNLCTLGNENADGSMGLEIRYSGEGALLADSTSFQFIALEGDFAAPSIIHTPPESGEAEAEGYSIEAELTDLSGIQRATIYYRLDEVSDPDSVSMSLGLRDAWSGSIPQQEGGSTVYYWLKAWDNSERHNARQSEAWSFPILSYYWPPQNVNASDGGYNRTLITWTPPAEPVGPDELLESFEAGIPVEWPIHSLDGTSSVWQQVSPMDGEGAVSGLRVAGINQEDGGTAGNEFMMTQGLMMGADAQLSFYYRSSYSWSSSSFNLVLSTSGNDEADATAAVVLESLSGSGTWTQAVVDLSAYSNQTVYLGWHFTGTSGYGLYLDDVHFTGLDVPVQCEGHRPSPGVVFPGRPELLAHQQGISVPQAIRLLQQWQRELEANRVFQTYVVYRDAMEIGRTGDLFFEDNAALGSLEDVVYDYTVSALYDIGESEASVANEGHWTGRPASGGPDDFGYSWYSNSHPDGPEFETLDISTMGTQLDIFGLDASDTIELPFDFFFYALPYSQVTVSSNGYLTFGTYGLVYNNTSIPSTIMPNDLIAVFWDDLNMDSQSKVYGYNDEANERFILQWTHMRTFAQETADLTFQAILYPQGEIVLQYVNMQANDLSSATSGVEDASGSMGLQVHYAGDGGPVESGSAVLMGGLENDFMPPYVAMSQLEDVETEIEGDYTVSAEIFDNASGIAEALVYYSTGGAYTSIAMTNTSESTYTAAIPHQDAGVSVNYYIEATDGSAAGNTTTSLSSSFYVISCEWAPNNIVASEGVLAQVLVTWTEPWLNTFFGADGARSIEELCLVHDWSKSVASAYYEAMHRPLQQNDRSFLMYHILRNGEEIGTTTDLIFADTETTGLVPGTTYSYSVSAEYEACTSDPGTPDSGSAAVPGGPDAYGYTWRNSNNAVGPVFEWVDISSVGTNLGIVGDDEEGTVTLSFDFPFYGEMKTSATVSSNGFLSFGTEAWHYSNSELPDADEPNDGIYPLWDDLTTTNSGDVYFYDDTDNNRAILQWQDVPHLNGDDGPYTFQLILYPNGNMLIQYQSLGTGVVDCTVGIENADGSMGLMYHYNGEIGSMTHELAVMFYAPINCDPVECQGENEIEPNDGWEGGAYTANEIDAGDTVCGTLFMDGNSANPDYYLYNHFGGGLAISTTMSDFNGVLRVLEAEQNGAVLFEADEWERCGNESLVIPGLENGQYFIVVDHDNDDPAIEGNQTYSMTLVSMGDPCDGHEPITCDGTPEVEPNEGWNSNPASYNEISSGDTYCGTIARVAGDEQSDWYHFNLSEAQDVYLQAEVDEFNAVLFITDFDPEGSVLADMDYGPSCYPEELVYYGLPAGDYYAVISCVDDVDFTEQSYSLHLEVQESSVAGPCDHLVDAGALVDEYSVTRPAPTWMHQNGIDGCPGSIPSWGYDEVHALTLTGTSNSIQITMQGEGNADEVIMLMGDCAVPASCGAIQDEFGMGSEAEVLQIDGLPPRTYYIVADFANAGESAAYTLTVADMLALEHGLVYDFELLGNHPNPFNPTTSIVWTQPSLVDVKLRVWNLLGEVVYERRLGTLPAGRHEFRWDASSLSSGLYVYRLQAGEQTAQGKLMLLK